MSRIIKLVDEINEYYNLNDTLLASDLGITQQTIRGWREGRQPTTPNYNKVKKMYEEMKQEAVDESIVQRFEALEEKVEKKPYEVKVPEDIETYYTIDIMGRLQKLGHYNSEMHEHIYKSGEAFEFSLGATLYYKERILLKRMEDWAEEHNGGWTPNWEDLEEEKWAAMYDNKYKIFEIYENHRYLELLKLPYFKSEEIAEQFIEEFGDKIKEVLC